MVDTSDFTIAYCPTNIYSVGTPHEIALCRQQRKPVLFVSPPVEFPALDALRAHLAGRRTVERLKLLTELEHQVPIKPNPKGIPSLWYMPLVGGESFFDGFGFDNFRSKYRWPDDGPLDRREKKHKPKRPLLPFLDELARKLPRKWDPRHNELRQKRRLAPLGSGARRRRAPKSPGRTKRSESAMVATKRDATRRHVADGLDLLGVDRVRGRRTRIEALADACRGRSIDYRRRCRRQRNARAHRTRARRRFCISGAIRRAPSASLKDYDHARYGPFLGISDEGSAAAADPRGGSRIAEGPGAR